MLSIIAAVAKNGAIGKDNKLLWHIPEDLKRFKRITTGGKLLMGRKTFESLPGVLPDREHIVVTNNADFGRENTKIISASALRPLLEQYADTACTEEVFVIGGESVYTQALPYCEKIYLTIVEKSFEADTFFPAIGKDWTVAEQSELQTDEKSGLQFYYQTLCRTRF